MNSDARRRQYWAIKEGLTYQEKELIKFYEIQWILRHNVPTIEQVAKQLGIKQTAVNYYLQRKPVIKSLDARGIPWREHSQEDLTATQVAAAITISNFADERSNAAKLDEMGISSATYYAWLNDPQFKNLVQNLADQNLGNIRPAAIGELTKKINAGDWNAVKFYLETTGELKDTTAPQSEILIKMIIEIIQRHVRDPKVIVAIAQDIKLASANKTLEIPMIESSAVEDVELTEARKKLGV